MTILVDIFGNLNEKANKIVNFFIQPFIWLGRNPLAIFVLMTLLAIFLEKYIVIDGKSAWSHFYHYVFASWISDPTVASGVFAFFFVVLWACVAGVMFRFKIFIKL